MRDNDNSEPLTSLCRLVAGCLAALFFMGIDSSMAVGQAPASLPSQATSQPAYKQRAARFLRGRVSATSMQQARQQQVPQLVHPRTTSLSAAWQPVGPTQVASLSYGDVTGRVTSIAIDPADATGNTVYVGTTGGGVWKSTNAAGPAPSVTFTPLTDTLSVFSANAGAGATPSLSIGALLVSNGVLLAGTGDPNEATDSYYGEGLLRSTDGGATWTLVQQSQDGVAGQHQFIGLGFAGLAASGTTFVAAVSDAAEGTLAGAADPNYSVMGLYYSTDAGQTWQMATIKDGSQTVQTPLPSGGNQGGNASTSVVWNAVRQRFYAAVRFHGFYESSDGMTWTRIASQPGVGLSLSACPTQGSPGCPIFRGVLAVQPVTGDTFALAVDSYNRDQGLWQDACALTSGVCATSDVTFATSLPSAAFETGNGSTVIPQADYDLALAAVPSGTDTLLFTGTVDLFRCSLAAGCVQRNTTNTVNGCGAPAMVAGAQHAIAAQGSTLLYIGNDGGLWRSTDGVNQQAAPCSPDDANHFNNLNGGIGSLAEVISFAQDPVSASTLLAGMGAIGTAGTGSASVTTSVAWGQLGAGEGGSVAIDPVTPANWYLSSASGVNLSSCSAGSACTASDFSGAPQIGAAQVAGEPSLIDAPWVLDPSLPTNVVVGTCRVWRGPAQNGASWTSSNELGVPFAVTLPGSCTTGAPPLVESLALGGASSTQGLGANAGSGTLYAGMAGADTGGGALAGHLFVTNTGSTDNASSVWTDAGLGTVTNDSFNAGVFNPAGFDISSLFVDPHDGSGATVYATVMGFSYPTVYRSTDYGAHWLNVTSNLANAPANAVIVDPNDANTVYVALDTGVYVTQAITSCATTNCWTLYGTGLPNAPVTSLHAAVNMPTGDGRTGELRAATYGRGIWQLPLLTAVGAAAPVMSLSPATLQFTSQAVGTLSALQTVTVTNTGTAPMNVTTVVANSDYAVTSTCAGSTVVVGASCTVSVGFLPTTTGTRSGLLTIYANVAGGQGTVALTGMGVAAPVITLNPTTLAFGAEAINTTSAALNVTLSNTGSSVVSLTSIRVTGTFGISNDTCSRTLPANSGCTISVTFTPTSAGAATGLLSILDSIGTQAVSLTGTGGSPATDLLSVSSRSFTPQQLNTASATQQVTLTNNGGLALTLINAQITSGDFTAVNGCGASLAASSSCAIAVAYVPKAVGPETGVLAVSDVYRTQYVSLSGSGVAPAGVSVSPSGGLSFAATPIASTAQAQAVTVTNNGGYPLNIAGIAATGDFAVVSGSSTCGATLPVNSSCLVSIAFTPTTGGIRTGTLTLNDNAPTSPQTVPLTGIGFDFSLTSTSPTTLTVVSGGTAVYQLALSSAAGVPGSVALTCAGAPAHTLCTVAPSSGTLGGTTAITVSISTGVAALAMPAEPWSRGPIPWLVGLVPLLLLRRRRITQAGLMLALCVTLSSCGSPRLIPSSSLPGASGNTTTSGTYAITVSGASTGVTRTVGLTLIVQ